MIIRKTILGREWAESRSPVTEKQVKEGKQSPNKEGVQLEREEDDSGQYGRGRKNKAHTWVPTAQTVI